jgi:hypothetical protein
LITHQGDERDEWVEIEPLVFGHVDEDATLVFCEEDGDVTHLLDGLGAYERISYHEQLDVQGRLAAIAVVTALTGAVGWPAARGWRWYRGGEAPSSSAARARWVAGAAVAGLALFVVALGGTSVALASMDRPTLYNRPPAWFGAIFVVPTIGALCTLGAAGYAARAWYRADWSLPTRVHYSGVVVAVATLYWLLHYWNLLLVRAG